MKYTLVGLSHWVAKGREWGDDFALHRRGCREAREGWYGVDYVMDVESIQEAVYTCFGDFINEYDDGMTEEEAEHYLVKCDCTVEDANFCNVSKCKHCGVQVYDLENATWVEWWADNECGCHREAVE